jgi:hypothetical protein
VVIGCLSIIAVITFATPLHMNFLGALLILVFGFLFATVSSRLTGEIGSSSNPISGMAVATLLFTCLIFLIMGWTGGRYYVTALSVGAIVCIAASNAGTTSQDLKTGYLVGATPRLQQYAILAGALSSALILGPILLKLNEASTVYVPAAQVAPGLTVDASKLTVTGELHGPQADTDHNTYKVWQKTDTVGGPAGKYFVKEDGQLAYLVDPGINGHYNKRPDGTEVKKYDAPKAVLMSYIIKGILDQQLPWTLVLFGDDRRGAGNGRHPVAGVFRRRVPATVVHLADLRRRPGALAGGPPQQQAGTQRETERGRAPAGGRPQLGRAAGVRLHRRRRAGRHHHRHHGRRADALRPDDGRLGRARQPAVRGPALDALSLLPYAAIIVLLYFVAREKKADGPQA